MNTENDRRVERLTNMVSMFVKFDESDQKAAFSYVLGIHDRRMMEPQKKKEA